MKQKHIDKLSDKKNCHRRGLLPWWIKFFCWVFMIAGILSLIALLLTFLGYEADLTIYGFDAKDNYPFNFILILSVFLFNTIVAYSLWFEKPKAILLGKINALIGIFLCSLFMILTAVNGNFTIRLEIILLVVFLLKLDQIKEKWVICQM